MSAVTKAVVQERARCLWVLDTIVAELRQQIDRKVLVESEIHLIKVKLAIAVALASKARRAIMSGVRPKAASNAETAEQIAKEIEQEGSDGY